MIQQNNIKHFEELWVACEEMFKSQKEIDPNDQFILIQELNIKINLYRNIIARGEISEKDKNEFKTRAMGEILLVLTNISLLGNIDVFNALKEAYYYNILSK